LAQAFSDVERRGGCLTHDDAPRVQAMVHEFETKVAAMLRHRDRPCARMFVAATARLAGVRIRSQRPVWPPQERPFFEEREDASYRFDRDLLAAKTLRGCRSVILGGKLYWPTRLVEEDVVRALLPPEVATGLRVVLPPGWHLHDVSPGRAEFVTFAEYYHGGIMPAGGADLSVYVTNNSVRQWLGNLTGSLDDRELEHLTIDGSDAVRVMKTIRPPSGDYQQRVLGILVPGERLALSFSWYIGDDHHPDDVEQMVRTARFFAEDPKSGPSK